jgi:hypothetical protein
MLNMIHNAPRFQVYLSVHPTERETSILKRMVDEYRLPVMVDQRNVQPLFEDLKEVTSLIYTSEGDLITNYEYKDEHVIALQWYCEHLQPDEIDEVRRQFSDVYGGPPVYEKNPKLSYLEDWGVFERSAQVHPYFQSDLPPLKQIIDPVEKVVIAVEPTLTLNEEYDLILDHQKKAFAKEEALLKKKNRKTKMIHARENEILPEVKMVRQK